MFGLLTFPFWFLTEQEYEIQPINKSIIFFINKEILYFDLFNVIKNKSYETKMKLKVYVYWTPIFSLYNSTIYSKDQKHLLVG